MRSVSRGVKCKIMKSIKLYIIGLILTAYAIFTIKYSLTGGAALPGIVAVFALVGAIGLFLKHAWSRFFIYIFSILIIPWWIFLTIWVIVEKGWPTYSTTYLSILGLLPGILLCLFCVFSCWVAYSHFGSRRKSST